MSATRVMRQPCSWSHGAGCDGSFELVDLLVGYPLHRGRARHECEQRGRFVGLFDVASSASAQPVQCPELCSLTLTKAEALCGPLVFLDGLVGLSAGVVELCGVVGWSGGDHRSVFGALVAQ